MNELATHRVNFRGPSTTRGEEGDAIVCPDASASTRADGQL